MKGKTQHLETLLEKKVPHIVSERSKDLYSNFSHYKVKYIEFQINSKQVLTSVHHVYNLITNSYINICINI